jgi:GTP-binding protein HflX
LSRYNISTEPEKAIIAGIVLPNEKRWEVEENLEELRQLAITSGVEVVDKLIQERSFFHPAHFLGKGKINELHQMVKMHKAQTVIFDADLSPAQVRNLEKLLDAKIIDRSTLILDIFAQHARTRAAKTQVELAQLQYLLPRLTRQWSHLSRQVGGVGTKGPGETQLETDRRLIRSRIDHLRKDLEKIDRQRITRRQGRTKLFRASLIGYTNVGKSTIMNLLSGSDVLVEDKLFATLDPTIRQVKLNQDHTILLSDTVGFIRKLPHHLVESFKSTLEEAVEADLLIHVIDVSHPSFMEQIHAVNEVLESINAHEKPMLMVFNKIDKLEDKTHLEGLRREFPNHVFISATRKLRVQTLITALIEFIEANFVETSIRIPHSLSRLVHDIHEMTVVEHQLYDEDGIHLRFRSDVFIRDRILKRLDTEQIGNSHI